MMSNAVVTFGSVPDLMVSFFQYNMAIALNSRARLKTSLRGAMNRYFREKRFFIVLMISHLHIGHISVQKVHIRHVET